MRILVFLLFSTLGFGQIPLFQLEYAADSNYVIGALPSGEPVWVLKSDISNLDSIYISNDTIYLRDGTGFAVIPEGLQIDSMKYQSDTLRLWTSAGLFKTAIVSGGTGTVKGTGTATRVAWWAASDSLSSDADLYWDNVNKRLGVGTTTPARQLTTTQDMQVNNIRIGKGNNSVLKNTIIGFNALNGSVTGDGNTGIGYNVLNANTTGSGNVGIGNDNLSYNTNGTYNTSIGSGTLLFNTTGSNNTAIGTFSMLLNTTGSNLTAIGYNAMRNVTTGYNNVAVGSSSMENTNTGYQNLAFGNGSLFSNQNGYGNVGLGNNALYGNIVGADNVAIGSRSLFYSNAYNNTGVGAYSLENNTSGNSNTGISVNALKYNTSGGSNNAIGVNSLFNNVSGSNNNTIGVSSLYSNVSGSDNTALGQNSGYHALGSSNIFIGSHAGFNETGSNKLYIANSNSTTNGIYGDFATSQFGINTNAPSRSFDVNGELRIRDLTTTTPTKLVSADNDGVLSSLGLSGLTISGGNLVGNTGTVKGTGTATRVAWWATSDSLSSDADLYWDNVNKRLGVGLTNPTGNIHSLRNYTNTSDVNFVAQGNIPMIGWDKTSSYRWVMGSGYINASTFSFMGASSTSSNPTTAIFTAENTGDITFNQNANVALNLRTGNSVSEFSFNHTTANPTNVQFYVNLAGAKTFRIQAANSLGYMEFYTPATGSNRNFRFATSYYNTGDFSLLRSSAAGAAPGDNVWTANPTGLGINNQDPTRALDVGGEVRIRDLTTTTPTKLVSADNDGVLSSLGLSGLTISGGNLVGNTGTVTGFSAGNLSPLFNSSVATSTTTPALTFAQISQNQNLFFASPNGSSGNPTFRSIVAADVPTLNQNTTGSAATLTTTRNIAMTGDVAWNVNFNGSAPVTAAGTLATVNANVGSFTNANITVNAKGLITAASNGTSGTVTTVTGTSPIIITSTPTTTPNVTIQNATTGQTGALTSTDWNTFNNKEPAITAGTTLQYWRGDKTWQTLNTSVVPESGNLYYTDARSRAAISLTTTGTSGAATYNSGTGVLNVPNYAGGGPGTGTINYIPKWATTTTLSGTSKLFDNGTNVGVNTTTPSSYFGAGYTGLSIFKTDFPSLSMANSNIYWNMTAGGASYGAATLAFELPSVATEVFVLKSDRINAFSLRTGSSAPSTSGTTRMLISDANGDISFTTIPTGGSGTVTSIATTNGITGGTITTSGTVQLTGQASALHNFTGTGFMVRTGASSYQGRSLTSGAGISITNNDGTSGNPTIAQAQNNFQWIYGEPQLLTTSYVASSKTGFFNSQSLSTTGTFTRGTNDSWITVPANGNYEVTWSAEAYLDGAGNRVVDAAIFISGTQQTHSTKRQQLGTDNIIQNISGHGIYNLTNGQQVSIRFVRGGGGSANAYVQNVMLTVKRIY